MTSVRGAGDYGFDAPYLIFIPAAVVAGNAAQAIWMRSLWPFVGTWIALLCMVSGLYTSRRGRSWCGRQSLMACRSAATSGSWISAAAVAQCC